MEDRYFAEHAYVMPCRLGQEANILESVGGVTTKESDEQHVRCHLFAKLPRMLLSIKREWRRQALQPSTTHAARRASYDGCCYAGVFSLEVTHILVHISMKGAAMEGATT